MRRSEIQHEINMTYEAEVARARLIRTHLSIDYVHVIHQTRLIQSVVHELQVRVLLFSVQSHFHTEPRNPSGLQSDVPQEPTKPLSHGDLILCTCVSVT